MGGHRIAKYLNEHGIKPRKETVEFSSNQLYVGIQFIKATNLWKTKEKEVSIAG